MTNNKNSTIMFVNQTYKVHKTKGGYMLTLEQRLKTEKNIITIALDQLPRASLEYLTGLAEGIKLARQEPENKKEEEEDN